MEKSSRKRMCVLPKHSRLFEWAVFSTGLVLSFLTGFVPYDPIGTAYGPLAVATLMASLLCSICTAAVALVRGYAISMGVAFTISMVVGMTKLFGFIADSHVRDIQTFMAAVALFGFFTLLITAPLTLHRMAEAKKRSETDTH